MGLGVKSPLLALPPVTCFCPWSDWLPHHTVRGRVSPSFQRRLPRQRLRTLRLHQLRRPGRRDFGRLSADPISPSPLRKGLQKDPFQTFSGRQSSGSSRNWRDGPAHASIGVQTFTSTLPLRWITVAHSSNRGHGARGNSLSAGRAAAHWNFHLLVGGGQEEAAQPQVFASSRHP